MKSKQFAGVAAISLACATTAAAIPPNSAHSTDPQIEYVQHDTSDSIASLNMVLCIVGSMGAGSMVNAGPYIALVDMNKCDNKQASAAAAGATNYATAVLDVARTSNSDPMIGKVWLSMSDQGTALDVFIHLSATQSPSSSEPYGLFRLDYLGKKNGVTGFNGFVDSQAASISQYETGNNSSNTALALAATSTSAGAGTSIASVAAILHSRWCTHDTADSNDTADSQSVECGAAVEKLGHERLVPVRVDDARNRATPPPAGLMTRAAAPMHFTSASSPS